MNERIKKIRKAEGLTQQEFADRLKIKRGAVANYEVGRNVPIDAVVALICQTFNVRETWLRTGEGNMYDPKEDFIGTLARDYDLDELDKKNTGHLRAASCGSEVSAQRVFGSACECCFFFPRARRRNDPRGGRSRLCRRVLCRRKRGNIISFRRLRRKVKSRPLGRRQ